MKFSPHVHHRHSLRLRGHNYGQPGAYFITICTQNRIHLFGEIVGWSDPVGATLRGCPDASLRTYPEMEVNDAGQMVVGWWQELPNKYPKIEVDEYTVMPNHFHGILLLGWAGDREDFETVDGAGTGQPRRVAPTRSDLAGGQSEMVAPTRAGQPRRVAPTGTSSRPQAFVVGHAVEWFKAMTTNAYIRGVKQEGWSPFPGRLWQRNYYEHVIRKDNEFNRIREYIVNNPANWASDKENREAPYHKPDEAWQV
ncbi:MAG: hypothetical protein HY675_01555 [Chloroflexi bacterium]|nr:hypothetical protein [Chloroflexota bacterium]